MRPEDDFSTQGWFTELLMHNGVTREKAEAALASTYKPHLLNINWYAAAAKKCQLPSGPDTLRQVQQWLDYQVAQIHRSTLPTSQETAIDYIRNNYHIV